MVAEVWLLGPLRVGVDGADLDVGHNRQQCLLAVLVVEANHRVLTDDLMERAWGPALPRRPRDTLYAYLSRLRRALSGLPDVRLAHCSGGYQLTIDEAVIDLHRFQRLVQQARSMAEDENAEALFDEALALWRGEPFAGLDTPWFNSIRGTLTEQRYAAELNLTDRRLRRGLHAELVSDLSTRAAQDPLHERLAAQLMLALYRCGRQAEALRHYEQTRLRLADELGADPSPALRQVHHQILTADSALDTADTGTTSQPAPAARQSQEIPTAAGSGTPVRQLPMDIVEFTGRQPELDRLHALAGLADNGTTGPVAVVIAGMAGVGKTRLAVRAGHLLTAAGRFDEIQLWADLRGFHPEQPPTEPSTVLENFLRLLGVPAHHLPKDLDAQAALYRDRLAGRRALVLLDDAASEDQIRPLLPGTPGCLVLITSRHTLTSLDGVKPVPLRPFDPDDAIDLLDHYAGHDRVHAEAEAARRLNELCGNLPLAIAVSARHLQARPNWRIDELAGRLEGDQRNLSQLSAPARAVRAIFDLSYRSLSTSQQRLFRMLALHPGQDFAAPSVSALTALPLPEAQAALEDLLDEHLLLPSNPHRFALHGLIRNYTTEQTHQHEAQSERHAALERLTGHYLDRARHATLLIYPTENRRVRTPSEPAPWRTVADAVDWVETEYENLVATVNWAAHAPGNGPNLALALIAALHRPLANRGHSTDRIALNQLAVRTARTISDRHAEAQALEDLGTLCGQIGLATDSLAYSHRALAAWAELDNAVGQQGSLADLGNSYRQQGDFEKAIQYLEQSRQISRESGNQRGEASALNFLGQTYQCTSEFDKAIDHLARSAALNRSLGNRDGEAIALANRGWAHQRAGQPHQAINCHRESLAVFHELEDRYNEAEQHWGIGQAAHQLNDAATARAHWNIAITMLQDIQILDEHQATELRDQDVPDTPAIIQLNT